MQKHLYLGQKCLTAICISILCVVVFSTGAWKPTTKLQQNDELEIDNKAQSFQVVGIVRDAGDYVLSLKNGYDKPINGYSIGLGTRGAKLDVELITGDRVISPGEIIETRIPISNLRRTASELSAKPKITILSVMFEDGTSNGDPEAIAQTEHSRLGTKIQLKRILPSLQAIVDLPDSKLPEALDKLKAEISSLPVKSNGSLPPAAEVGLRSAKEDLLREIENLGQDRLKIRSAVTKIKESGEKRVAKL